MVKCTTISLKYNHVGYDLTISKATSSQAPNFFLKNKAPNFFQGIEQNNLGYRLASEQIRDIVRAEVHRFIHGCNSGGDQRQKDEERNLKIYFFCLNLQKYTCMAGICENILRPRAGTAGAVR